MHKKHFFLFPLLLLVLLSCQKEEPKNNHPNLGPGQLKVMTFNIRGTTTEDDAFNNWGMRAGACRDMIIDQQPSIVGFQELVATEWKYMSGTLASHGYVGAPVDDPMNSFMYRPDELEVLSEGFFWLSDTPDKSSTSWDGYVRYVHWAVMKVLSSGQEFFYINTHFGLTTASRKSAMTLIQKRREVAPITDDVKTYNAWGNEAKAYQCDHIWITNTIKCSEYKTVTQWYDGHKYVSDHFPVYSIIEF